MIASSLVAFMERAAKIIVQGRTGGQCRPHRPLRHVKIRESQLAVGWAEAKMGGI